MQARTNKIVAIAVSAVILAVVIALNIAVGIFSPLIDAFVVGYKDGSNSSAERAKGSALVEQIQSEGSVLVKNAPNAQGGKNVLPLDKEIKKVNVFGWNAVDWVISGSGSGQVKGYDYKDSDGEIHKAATLLSALTDYGVEYNQELINMYSAFGAKREFSKNGGNGMSANPSNSGSLHSFNYEFSRLYEPNITDKEYYGDALLENAKNYSNTAIVTIGRVSGESNDSPKVQYKRVKAFNANSPQTGKPSSLVVDESRTYLEISTEEEELLKYVGKNFENVIVLINSTNVMELGFLESIEGLDAGMVVATTGRTGANAIPKLLYGDISPSGKLADTYAYDLSTSPTYFDTGAGNDTTNFYTGVSSLYPLNVTHTNGSSPVPYTGVAYTDYRESVYLGYRWYETADVENYWQEVDNAYGKGYDGVVQYPFGFGLSYSDFTWEVTKLTLPNNSTVNEDDKIVVGVTVKNNGDMPAHEVVQLYYSAPYTSGGIEKSALVLGAFGKTKEEVKPNETGYIELIMNVSDMKSYDCYNLSGKVGADGGYILEAGNYTLTLRTDAHTPAGEKVASGNILDGDTLVYTVANDILIDEESVKNRFTGENTTDGVAIDGNSDGTAQIAYLSRSNFKNTFPSSQSSNRAMNGKIAALNLYTTQMANTWDSEWETLHPDAAPIVTGASSGDVVGSTNGKVFEISGMGRTLGIDYDADEWEEVLDRMTIAEMQNLVLHGYTKTNKVASIGKIETKDYDGPNQMGSFNDTYAAAMTGYSSIVLAQTFNEELAYSMGLAFGSEAADAGVSGWYGPALNLHRSPFGGRNYEYYSEDALLSGAMTARVVTAAKNKGVYSWLKHLCLYETESGRDGMYTWLTEQALRELYIKPFEIAVKDGEATAMMTSYGRIGAVWTGGSEALLTEVVRGEWGFKGAFITDYADHHEFMNGNQMIRAGGDLWMDGVGDSGSFTKSTTNSIAFGHALRRASKNIIYTWLNALATNADYNEKVASGEINDTISVPSSPELNFRWYIPVLIAVDVLALAGLTWWIVSAFRRKDNEPKHEIIEE